jgi:hypothetical protein
MLMKKWIARSLGIGVLLFLTAPTCFADPDGLGQTIQIYTQLKSYYGKPTWLLIIRDIDNNQNLPYVYDFEQGDNFWLAFTFGRNYLITASRLTFNPHVGKRINNFCGLESNGRILRGESLYVTLQGNLTPNTNTFTCSVLRYTDSNFTITKPSSAE